MSNIIPFERAFDATDMTVDESREQTRTKDSDMKFFATAAKYDNTMLTKAMMVLRLTRQAAYNE